MQKSYCIILLRQSADKSQYGTTGNYSIGNPLVGCLYYYTFFHQINYRYSILCSIILNHLNQLDYEMFNYQFRMEAVRER